jgi:hypothetical protein
MSDAPSRPSKVKVTVELPADRLESFHAMLDEFSSGESRWDVMQALRANRLEKGKQALARLFAFAETNSCGGSAVIAHFLASMYNGNRFKVDLTDLRLLSSEYFQDMLDVLYLDHAPAQEVHQYFANGGQRFEAMFKRYGLEDQGHAVTHLRRLGRCSFQDIVDALTADPVAAGSVGYAMRSLDRDGAGGDRG